VYITTSTDQDIAGLKTIKIDPTGTGYDSAAFLIEPKTNQTTNALFGIGIGGTFLETEEKFVVTPSSVAIRNADLRFKGSSGSKIQLLLGGLVYFGSDENIGISRQGNQDGQSSEDWIRVGTDLNVVGNYRKNGVSFDTVYITSSTAQDISGRKTIVNIPDAGSTFSNAALVINTPAGTPLNSNLFGVGLDGNARFRVATSSVIVSNADLQFTTVNKKINFDDGTNLYRHTDGSKLVTDGSFQAKGNSNEFGVIVSSVVTSENVVLKGNKKVILDRDGTTYGDNVANNTYIGYDTGNNYVSFYFNGQEVARLKP